MFFEISSHIVDDHVVPLVRQCQAVRIPIEFSYDATTISPPKLRAERALTRTAKLIATSTISKGAILPSIFCISPTVHLIQLQLPVDILFNLSKMSANTAQASTALSLVRSGVCLQLFGLIWGMIVD
jgi:hypothetical protein